MANGITQLDMGQNLSVTFGSNYFEKVLGVIADKRGFDP